MSLDEQVKLLSRRVGVLEAEAEIARRLAGFDQRGAERERLYRFIEAETANFTLTMLCRVCQVSPLGLLLLASRRRRRRPGHLGRSPGRRCHIRHLGAARGAVTARPG